MARTKNRRSKGGRGSSAQGNIKSVLLALGSVAAVAALIGAFWYSEKQNKSSALDPVTLCPVEAGPTAMIAILMDMTDPLSPAQIGQLKTYLYQELEHAEQGTQFTFGLVSEAASLQGATQPSCKPPRGADSSMITANPTQIETRYQEAFIGPMRDLIEQMTQTTTAQSSPIMESLQALVSESEGFLTFTGPRRLIVVSDLLQHSDVHSFYRGHDWKAFQSSGAARRISETLSGVEVKLYQIPRSTDRIKNPKIIDDFWLNYFDYQGSKLPSVKRLGDL